MTLIHTHNGSAITGAVEITSERGIHVSAELGEPSGIQLIVDDPGLSITITPLKTWLISEDTAPANNQVVWAGYVDRRHVGRRGEDVLFPDGRVWKVTLRECNALLTRRLLKASEGANRPAETVSARLTWLLTTAGFSGIIADYGNVASSSVELEAWDYTNQNGQDVLQELALRSGFNYYVRWSEAQAGFELFFYDAMISGFDTSTFEISNADDHDYSTIWPPAGDDDAELEMNPDRIASTIAVPTGDATAYANDAAVATAYAAVDQIAPDAQVQSLGAAQVLADRLIGEHATEEETVRGCRVQVPAADVNDIRAGQVMFARMTHFPDVNNDWPNRIRCRVKTKSVSRPTNRGQAFYVVELDLSPTNQPATARALVRGPNDNNIPGSLTGTFVINWDGDGEDASPPGGCSTVTKTGAFSYLGSAGERTGIQADGAGSPAVTCVVSYSGTVNGTVAIRASVRVNGVEVAFDEDSTSGGLRALSGSLSISDTISVEAGDVIDVAMTLTGDISIMVVPAGSGNCANLLDLSGSLVS